MSLSLKPFFRSRAVQVYYPRSRSIEIKSLSFSADIVLPFSHRPFKNGSQLTSPTALYYSVFILVIVHRSVVQKIVLRGLCERYLFFISFRSFRRIKSKIVRYQRTLADILLLEYLAIYIFILYINL